jgi:transposase InsO family protein
LPGERIDGLPVCVTIHCPVRPNTHLLLEVLRRPVEFAVYTSIAFTQRLIDEGVDPSVGSVGDAFDNALAESTVGSFKTELIHRQGPWRDVDHVEIETLNWVDWFNNERRHESLADLTPAAAEQLHYDYRTTLATAG